MVEKYYKISNLLNWVPFYLISKLKRFEKPDFVKPIHVMFCVVDHFEPFNGGVSLECARERVDSWVNEYPLIATKHKDGDGKFPKHTWFYPPHLDQSFLLDLLKLCARGFGEIEMHLHHNHMKPFPDTSDTLREKIFRCLQDYSKHEIFCLQGGSKKFAFIHGDWSLDNSRGNKICGVSDEIRILNECGCYADFTFPSLGEAQPAMVNTIYYATDNPCKSKSYNWGNPVVVKGCKNGDLLMIPGVIGFRWKSRTHRFRPSLEASNIDEIDYLFPGRIDFLVKNGIKIKGKPNWIFLKLHTHGAREDNRSAFWGEKGEAMFRYLEDKYNDGKKYILHYVTAREMYNIIKAAEAGREENPGLLRDFSIPKYNYLRD